MYHTAAFIPTWEGITTPQSRGMARAGREASILWGYRNFIVAQESVCLLANGKADRFFNHLPCAALPLPQRQVNCAEQPTEFALYE